MPLPALPAHNVPRYRLNYTTGNVQHAMVIHMSPLEDANNVIAYSSALANLLKPTVYTDCLFTSVDFAPAGSDVFNQVGTMSIAGTGAGTQPVTARPFYACYVARSPSGRKTRIFFFGAGVPGDLSWRITTVESAAVAAIVSGLNSGTGGIRTIDGQIPVWKPYMNYGASHRMVRRIRRTG